MARETSKQPSSATAGFFQAYPVVPPAYTFKHRDLKATDSPSDDAVLANILDLYLPSPLPRPLDDSIHDFARRCLDPDTLRLMVDCETNHPTLHPLSTFGEVNNVNPLRTSKGWRGLKDIQTQAGIVAHGYRDVPGTPSYNRRVHQFALAHLWSPSCASVSCPAAMSDGAAILLSKHLRRRSSSSAAGQDPDVLQKVLQEAYNRLVSFDPDYAWTSGQWMTERPGGSDVSRTETMAHLASAEELVAEASSFGDVETDSVGMALGPYIINGFKWFSSATDADMVVLLAQTSNGLSAFYAPMKRLKVVPDGSQLQVMNGVRISRLKNKMGTKGLPTAELEIKGMRGWLLGQEGKGVREISAILNATRLWTACGAVGGWGRGLAVARAYSTVRKIKGEQILADNKQHVRWMANETVKYRACAQFSFLGVALLGIAEMGWEGAARDTKAGKWLPKDKQTAELLLRILTPVMKAQCSLHATLGLRECMESLGGVGYCENLEDGGVMNVARMFRDGNVNSVWEGTTNILAEDLIRVLKGRIGTEALGALGTMIEEMLGVLGSAFDKNVQMLRQKWQTLVAWLEDSTIDGVLYRGRETLEEVQNIVCSILLMIDALNTQAALEGMIADRWFALKFGETKVRLHESDLLSESENDRNIFLGVAAASMMSRSKL